MATLKKRLHKFNGAGYDTLYFETAASCVRMESTGQTLDQIINTINTKLTCQFPIYNKYGQNLGAASTINENCIMIGTFTDKPDEAPDGQANVITHIYAAGWRRQIWISPHGSAFFWRSSASNDIAYSNWAKIYDSGNLAPETIGALWAKNRVGDINTLNNPNYPIPYMTTTWDQESAQIGLPRCWYHLLNFRHWDNNGYNAQLAISLNAGYPDIRVRTSSGTNWDAGGWRRIPLVEYGTTEPGGLTDGTIYCIYE